MNHTIQTTLNLLLWRGYPEPAPEFMFHPDRKWRFDWAWPTHSVAWEIEGGTWVKGRHVRPKGFAEDCVKYSEAAVLGWKVIRTTTEMVERGEALQLLERALQ